MKNTLRLFLLFLGIAIQAQMTDLQNLASGDFVKFSPIFNTKTEKLEGYLSLYLKGEESKEFNNFEAVVLDKNLNTVFTKEFKGEKLVTYYSSYIEDAKLILNPKITFNKFSFFTNSAKKVSMFGYNKRLIPTSKEIDLKTGDISIHERYYVKDGVFLKLKEGESIKALRATMKAQKGKSYTYEQMQLKNKQYFVIDHAETGKKTYSNSMRLYDQDRKLIWKYEYSKNETYKNKKEFQIVGIDEKNIFVFQYHFVNKKIDNVKLLTFDTQTSKIIAEKNITKFFDVIKRKISRLSIIDTELYDDRLTIVGYNTDNKGYIVGYKGIVIDRNTQEASHHNIKYLDLKSSIPKIGKRGKVEGGMFLRNLDTFITRNGNVNMILEKHRAQGNYAREKTTDLVLITTTPSFHMKNVKVIKKETTKGLFKNNDYLFGQKVDNDNKVQFFYQDKVKDAETRKKNWILYINKISKEGEYTQEQMQMSSKKEKYFIHPYVAKEGYILLREFNKKDKYNAVRLEKLNLQ